MPPLPLSSFKRRTLPRRLLQLAGLGLAGLIAGLLAGCSSDTSAQMVYPRNDTDWRTSSNYASATASLGPESYSHTPHLRSCLAAPCEVRVSAVRPSHRTGM
jgi:hypothetical protein